MKPITFYPGPSKIYPQVQSYYSEGLESGIFESNHRSPAFMDLLKNTKSVLKKNLEIPENYEIVFLSSATECWELVAQSLTFGTTFHLFNGAFGEKWHEYTQRITGQAIASPFSLNDEVEPDSISIPKGTDVICITQNETSNATQVKNSIIKGLKERFPDQLLAIDATSSMAGINLDWQYGDIWFASVQKCFGLPPGMAVMILSEQATLHSANRKDSRYYNSLNFVLDNFRKNQTPYTPNIPNVYLLYRVLSDTHPIRHISEQIEKRARLIDDFLRQEVKLSHLVNNGQVRSQTVLAYSINTESFLTLKETFKDQNVVLGNGYGQWKNTSFRIANFPAIEDWEIEKLFESFNSLNQN